MNDFLEFLGGILLILFSLFVIITLIGAWVNDTRLGDLIKELKSEGVIKNAK